MKRIIIAIIGALICSSMLYFTSCTDKAEFYDLAICGSYAVPGMFASELKGGVVSCDVIETDSYGRILFEYEAYSNITNQDETAYVICQKYDSKYVYFYEDIGYMFEEDYKKHNEYLKSQNDWNLPLDEVKMSRRKNEMTFDLCIAKDTHWNWSETKDACAQVLHVDSTKIQSNGFVDCDTNNNQITLIICNEEKSTLLFAMTRTDGTVSVLEITDHTLDQVRLSEWKQKNGWIYGFRSCEKSQMNNRK